MILKMNELLHHLMLNSSSVIVCGLSLDLSILLITLLVHKDDISHEHLKELLYEEIMSFQPAPITWGSSGFR